MTAISPAERYARNQIEAMAGERPPLYQHPTFPTREVRAGAVLPGDVIAERVTGEPLTVLAVGYPPGYVVVYGRSADAHQPGATDRLHFTRHELVRRATTAPDAVTSDRAVPTVERTTTP